MKPVVSNDGLTELQVPSNWSELTGPDRNPNASMQYCNIFAETYSLVLTETKAEVAAAMEKREEDFVIGDYADLIINSLKQDGFNVEPDKTVTVNGLKGIRVRLKTKHDGIKIAYFVTFVEGKTHFHQVHCWTLQSREERNMPTLEKVANSFRER